MNSTELVDQRKWNPQLDWAKLRSKMLHTVGLQQKIQELAATDTAGSGDTGVKLT